jgi:hypothetical protein
VADDLVRAGKLRAGGGVVESAKQPRRGDEDSIGVARVELIGDVARDVGEDLSAIFIDAEETGDGTEPRALEVQQKRVDEFGVWTLRSADGIPGPDYPRGNAAAQERDL